ncbi:unnamed protein product [Ectocarpus sp. 13 AM-2016]
MFGIGRACVYFPSPPPCHLRDCSDHLFADVSRSDWSLGTKIDDRCSTVKPVDVYRRRMSAADDSEPARVARSLAALKENASLPAEEVDSAVKVNRDRELTSVPKWKATEKWRTANDDGIPKWQRSQKWKTKKDDGSEPKWRTNQKWKNRNDSSDDSSSSDAA